MEPTCEKPTGPQIDPEYNELKTKVHDRLIDILDLSVLDSLVRDVLEREIRKAIEGIMAADDFTIPLNSQEKEQFLREIEDEVLGVLAKVCATQADSGDEADQKKVVDRTNEFLVA